ncbi:MAG TPA: MBL fold metallo-hydrolase [Methanobacterium sp.]|jgi:glyoxylase-like metal-dependent hydrolase (beta-lactamase superfamily II)|nr:MBL fold metallo-hydrolase [Methanobacterium sp.]
MYKEIIPKMYLIKTKKPSCQSYLILGDKMNVLIDPGINQNFEILKKDLRDIGLDMESLNMIINTHEHVDHFGANLYLQEKVPVITHRNAATKIVSADDEVLLCRAHGHDPHGYHVHMWLENMNVMDLGRWFLKIFHTPGHTSGSLCVYEPRKRILISGDTVFARGTISNISSSGSYGEYINSLARLNTMKIDLLLPGHGKISSSVEEDIDKAIRNATRKHEKFLEQSKE